MSESATVKLQVKRRYDFSAERVYDAFLDPALAGRFLFATETGHNIRTEVDARVGGTFVIVDRRPTGDAAHYGRYVELDRPRRLAFRFSVEQHGLQGDLITIDIVPSGEGCELTLTHEMPAAMAAQYGERAKGGWTGILSGLDTLLRDA